MASLAQRRGAAALTVAVMSVVLAGCVQGNPMPVPTYEPTGTASATPGPAAEPKLRPGEGAEANKPYFDKVAEQFLHDNGMGDGRAAIDHLVAAGFDKSDMQVTPDTTALGIAVDALIFSVRIRNECLIGQYSAAGYKGIIAPVLGTGNCLIGTTRPIDW